MDDVAGVGLGNKISMGLRLEGVRAQSVFGRRIN